MHKHCEVWIPHNRGVKKQIEIIMSPYCEGNDREGEHFWDWYQVGGRWTGVHTPEYHPEEDPKNMQTCYMCGGTGVRTDENVKDSPKEEVWEGVVGTRCNVCDGNGVEVLWPTHWRPYEKDVISVSEIPDKFSCHTLVLPGETLHSQEYHPEAPVDQRFQNSPRFPNGDVKVAIMERGMATGYLVTVDYHS